MSARGLAAAAAVLLALSGCGDSQSPADDVPELAAALEDVDEALAAEDYEQAEEELTGLVDVSEQAEAEGTLSSTEADDIVGAAEALLSQLPDEPESPTPPSSETEPEPEPTVAPEPEPEPEPEDEGKGKPPKPPKEPKEPKGGKGPKGKGG